jgi:hypothetical protein
MGYNIINNRSYQELVNAGNLFPLNSVNSARLIYFYNLFRMTEDVPGDVVECGVGEGRSFIMLSNIIKITSSLKNIWGFDSFEGFPSPSPEDTSIRNTGEGQHAVDSRTVWQRLHTYIKDDVFIRQRVILIKGFFEDTLDNNNLEQISLLNLDVDLYESYRICLEKLYPKVTPGGIITFDEYLRENLFFPGAMKAINEFFTDKKDRFIKDKYFGKYYVIKS